MVTYTSSSTYWAPLKPRIRIYAFSDSTYSSSLYTYNAFTDVGVDTKPVSLNFDSETVNVGFFSIEIEDNASSLDPDTYMRGNRVFIECSKDGSTWQPAFKGLVRGTDQNIYATSGRNLVLNGYSYLVRLNERVLNTIKESSLTGSDYNRTDSTMFTNNLINDLLTTDSHYIKSNDDTQLYSIFKTANISSSPIVEWIPRLDAQLVTLNDAINSILEFSNGLVMLNPSDDQLMLYTNDLVTSATGIFLITNQMNQTADDADYTMYPLEPYQYNISYDYPDSGSRLIGSIGSGGTGEPCPETELPTTETPATSINNDVMFMDADRNAYAIGDDLTWAAQFKASKTDMNKLRIKVDNYGDMSASSHMTAQIWTRPTLLGSPGSQIGSNMTLYKDRTPGKAFPEFTATGWALGLEKDTPGVSGLTVGTVYYLAVMAPNNSQKGLNPDAHYLAWNRTFVAAADHYPLASRQNTQGTWDSPTYNGYTSTYDGPLCGVYFDFGDIISEECGGGGASQATIDADPVFAIAHDRNMSGRIGVVERIMTEIPTHIKKAQTLNEYLFNKLYFAAKPRFTFGFPSVSMCNKLPKAGDIVAHVDSMTNVGTQNGPIQTGVISSVQYSFEQGKGQDDALGLRRLSVSTTGIKRGSY